MPQPERLGTFEIGDWVVDPWADEVVLHGKATKVEPRAMRLLVCLAQAQGQLVSSQRLLDEVWTGVIVSPGSLYEAVSQLRKALGDTESPSKYIATVARKGYRLVAPVRWREAAPSPAADSREADGNPSLPESATEHRRVKYRRGAMFGTLTFAVVCVLMWLAEGRYSRLSGLAGPRSAPKTAGADIAPVRPPVPAKSIAAVPFTDLSEKHDQGYLADGIAEEILDSLATIPTMHVVARTSSFRFRNTSLDLREVGRKLGVAYILEGSLRRSQERVRVTVQLIDADDGMHRWSGSYERPLGDLLQLQSDIAAAVARAVQLTMDGGAIRAEIQSVDPRAYELFLRARYALDRSGREDLEEGIVYLEESLQLDPHFARAASQLAAAQCVLALNFDNSDLRATRAREALEVALRLGYGRGVMHAFRAALLQFHDFDFAAAQAEMDRALQTEPTNQMTITLAIAAGMAMSRGHNADAARYLRTALAKDPLNVGIIESWELLLLLTGRYREAWEEGQRAVAISSRVVWARFYSGRAALALGDTRAALEAFEQTGYTNARLAGLAAVHYVMGHKDQSDKIMQRLEQQAANEDAYLIALAHAYRRETAAAMHWLERARLQKDANLASGRGDPAFASYADDPHYRALVAATYPSD